MEQLEVTGKGMQAGEPTRAQRMMCDHLPEAPVHRGVQEAQAAQGDPEGKARQCQYQQHDERMG